MYRDPPKILTPEQAKLVQDFQPFYPDELTNTKLVEVLLVIAGYKMGTVWHLMGEPSLTPDLATPVGEEAIEAVLNLLDKLPVTYKLQPGAVLKNMAPPKPYAERRLLLVANSTQRLSLMEKLWADLAGYPIDNDLHGQVSGIPSTAISAFKEGRHALLPREEIPLDAWQSSGFAFGKFMYSRKNWEEELAVAQSWADYVEIYAPRLFEETLAERDRWMAQELGFTRRC